MNGSDSLEVRRLEAESAIAQFLAGARNTRERRFWIGRTQQALGKPFNIATGDELTVTSELMRDLNMRTCPFLAIAAMHWLQEFFTVSAIPSQEQLRLWHARYSRVALGEGWEPRSVREQRVRPALPASRPWPTQKVRRALVDEREPNL